MKLPLLASLALSAGLVFSSYAQSLQRHPSANSPASRPNQTNGLRLTLTLEQSFRNNAWKDTIRTINSNFTSADLPGRTLEETSPNGTTWIPKARHHFRYNAANAVLTDTTFTFSPAGVATARIAVAKSYTATDSLGQVLSRYLFGTGWGNYGRDVHTYNAQNHKTRVVYEGANFGGTGYIVSAQTLYTNNAQGKPIIIEDQQAGATSGTWELGQKDLLTYNTAGLLSTYIKQLVPDGGASYQNYSRETHTYDAAVPTRVVRKVLDGWRNNAWSEIGQYLYAYDNSGNLTSITTQVLVSPGNYRNYYRTVYSYAITTAATSRALNTELSVFPNPTASAATVQYRLPAAASVSVDVFDALGRRVAAPMTEQPQVAGEQRVAVPAGLKAGLYTVRLRTADGRSQQSKLVVQ